MVGTTISHYKVIEKLGGRGMDMLCDQCQALWIHFIHTLETFYGYHEKCA